MLQHAASLQFLPRTHSDRSCIISGDRIALHDSGRNRAYLVSDALEQFSHGAARVDRK